MAQKKRYEKKWMILTQDLLLSMLSSLLAILLVRWISEPIPGYTTLVLKWLGVSGVFTLIGILFTKVHLEIRRFATVRSIGKVVLVVLIKEVALTLSLVFGLVKLEGAFAVMAVLADLLLTGVLLSYIRMQARLFIKEHHDVRTQATSRSALVVGTDEESIRLADRLQQEGWSVAGLVTRDPAMAGRVIRDRVVYACQSLEDMRSLQWRLGGIDGLFFTHTDGGLDAPDSPKADEPPQRDGMSFMGHVVKRGFDVGLSAFLLLLFSPLIGLCALLVKKEDGGPVIFAQERIGREGKPFQIYKFRSMRVDAEKDGAPALYSGESDLRLTRTGQFLRAHHLDELPQLWNVLKGDMSFIGYRPERRFYIDQIMSRNARYRYLYQIRPGVTSYATLYNGYTDTLEKMLTRLDLDLYYLRNHSVWFDAKVLGLTFLSIVIGKKF